MIELYEFKLSGNCHKVRLLLSLLKLEYKSILVDGSTREQKSDSFLAINPLGQVPVLRDGKLILRDSQAILAYLARAYGEDHWFPADPAKSAQVISWLSTAANEIARGPGDLRAHYLIGKPINETQAHAATANILSVLDKHLQQNEWLATTEMTIADVAVYPYVAMAHQGKVEITPYSAVRKWLARIEKLPGYVSMPGIELQ